MIQFLCVFLHPITYNNNMWPYKTVETNLELIDLNPEVTPAIAGELLIRADELSWFNFFDFFDILSLIATICDHTKQSKPILNS